MKDHEFEMEGIFMFVNNSTALKMNLKYKRIYYFLILLLWAIAPKKKTVQSSASSQNPISP